MTNNEFVIWLKGLIAGAPKYQPNPEQWKAIREEIEKVDDGNISLKAITDENGNFKYQDNTSKGLLND